MQTLQMHGWGSCCTRLLDTLCGGCMLMCAAKLAWTYSPGSCSPSQAQAPSSSSFSLGRSVIRGKLKPNMNRAAPDLPPAAAAAAASRAAGVPPPPAWRPAPWLRRAAPLPASVPLPAEPLLLPALPLQRRQPPQLHRCLLMLLLEMPRLEMPRLHEDSPLSTWLRHLNRQACSMGRT